LPTNKHILFGHHFAPIAGAGPLVVPVLSAQLGSLPSSLWLIAAVVLAGSLQDFLVLFLSSRRYGRSLVAMVLLSLGRIPGTFPVFVFFPFLPSPLLPLPLFLPSPLFPVRPSFSSPLFLRSPFSLPFSPYLLLTSPPFSAPFLLLP
ncbi:carbon starvation CstA family protein, partial [Pseudomonas paraveronii]|uniref:carbon starvation CstA family protein n=1 Tax=Pseudomonas paraveronii TaxID=3040598 RepID=UPI002AB008B6